MLSTLQTVWLLAIFLAILVLIAGCMTLPQRQYRPTPVPSAMWTMLPLIDYATPSSDLPAISPTITEPSNLRPRSTSPPDNPSLNVEAPTCYEAPDGGYICLGRVWNEGDSPSGSVWLSLQASDQSSHTLTAQQRIAPQRFAPYRVRFDTVQSTPLDIQVRQLAAVPVPERLTSLIVEAQRGNLTATHTYRLTATIYNPHDFMVGDGRMIATLVDTEWGIVGYRVLPLPVNLAPRSRHAVELTIIPAVIAPEMTHHLAVEAYALSGADQP